jgi:hypothetical protein
MLRVFGRRLFEQSEFPTAAQDLLKIEDEAAGGSFFFGFFLLAKQKKETRQSGETDIVASFAKRSNFYC